MCPSVRRVLNFNLSSPLDEPIDSCYQSFESEYQLSLQYLILKRKPHPGYYCSLLLDRRLHFSPSLQSRRAKYRASNPISSLLLRLLCIPNKIRVSENPENGRGVVIFHDIIHHRGRGIEQSN